MNIGEIIKDSNGRFLMVLEECGDDARCLTTDLKILTVYNEDTYKVNLDITGCSMEQIIDKMRECEEVQNKRYLTQGEHDFLSFIDPDCFLCRNEGGLILICEDEPTRGAHNWLAPSIYVQMRDNCFLPMKFEAIRWTDARPWKVFDLLKLEVR